MNKMKKSLKINEDYLRGVPEYVFKEETSKFVENIKKHIFNFMAQNTSVTPQQQRESYLAAEGALEILEEKVNNCVEETLWTFTQNI